MTAKNRQTVSKIIQCCQVRDDNENNSGRGKIMLQNGSLEDKYEKLEERVVTSENSRTQLKMCKILFVMRIEN